MITKTAVAIAILAAGITSSANAAGLKFTGAELGVVSHTWFYAGESYSTTHYKAKGKVDITDTVFSLEGRMVLDRMIDLSITQMHLTFGAELSPSTKVGFSLGKPTMESDWLFYWLFYATILDKRNAPVR